MDESARAPQQQSRLAISAVVDGLSRVNVLRNVIGLLGSMGHETPEVRAELLQLTYDLAESGREACTLMPKVSDSAEAYRVLREYLDEWDDYATIEEHQERRRAATRNPFAESGPLSDYTRVRPVRTLWEAIEATLCPDVARARAAFNRKQDDLLRRRLAARDMDELQRIAAEGQGITLWTVLGELAGDSSGTGELGCYLVVESSTQQPGGHAICLLSNEVATHGKAIAEAISEDRGAFRTPWASGRMVAVTERGLSLSDRVRRKRELAESDRWARTIQTIEIGGTPPNQMSDAVNALRSAVQSALAEVESTTPRSGASPQGSPDVPPLRAVNNSRPTDPAGTGDDEGMFTSSDLAERFGVNAETLRKRLDRWREKNVTSRDWTENEGATSRDPKYLYRLGAVRHLIALLQASGESSGERPAKKK